MRRWTICEVGARDFEIWGMANEFLVGSSEVPMVGDMTFHTLGLIVAASCSLIAIILSFYLIWMHAIHYTKPYEQRQYVHHSAEPLELC